MNGETKRMKLLDRIDSIIDPVEERYTKWRKKRRETMEALPVKERLVKRYKEILIFAAIVFTLDILVQLIFTPQRETFLTMLSNGLMISGMLITAWGLIRLGEYFGSLDALIYATRWDLSSRSWRNADEYEERQKRSESFAEFRRKRQENRVSPTPLFVVGIPLVILSAIIGYIAIM